MGWMSNGFLLVLYENRAVLYNTSGGSAGERASYDFGGGDGYGSSFLYSLLKGKEIIECLEFGSASASILISAHSCSDAMPSAAQVEAFIKKSKEEYGEMVARV